MPRTTNQNRTQETETESSMEQLKMEAFIKEQNPERGVLATADVKIGDIMTIRNVKIKEDDYGLTVTMPHTDEYKDSVFFTDKSLKEQFDQIVQKAYQDSIISQVLDVDEPEDGMEQEDAPGMSMGM